MSQEIYGPCPCGSGQKLKFCCYKKGKALGAISNAELVKQAPEFKVYDCLINEGWQESGLAQIVVVRQMPDLKYMMGVYLVDMLCLGLKDTFIHLRLKYSEIEAFLKRFPEALIEFPYENSRSVVLGAIEYAAKLGFEPNQDWKDSQWIIEGTRDFERKFNFGKDGKPCYVQGPHDDVHQIMAKLKPLIQVGQVNFVADPEILEWDEDDEVDKRHDEIARLLESGRFDKAKREAEDFIYDHPESFEAQFLMGTCLAMRGDYKDAIPYFKEAIALKPLSSEVYYNLAGTHQKLLEIKECVFCLEKVIKLDGKKGEYGRRAQKDLEELRSMIERNSKLTLEEYIKNKDCFEKAFEYLKIGRFEEAIEGFHQVLRLEPNHVQSHGNLGLAYAGLGKREIALKHFDCALKLDPEYTLARDNRRVLERLASGEKLDMSRMGEIEFYTEKVKSQGRQNFLNESHVLEL